MKRTLLSLCSILAIFPAFAQTNSYISLYGGGGIATTSNYNVAISGGLEYAKGIHHRTFLGVNLFYQQYYLLYDDEANGAKNGNGVAGMSILNKSSYIFIAPQLSVGLGKNQKVKAYLNFGVGFNGGGTETTTKWNYASGAHGNYDSIINTSSNIAKTVYRVGFGLKEYANLNHHWWFSFTEDFGFLTSSISKASDPGNPNETIYSPRTFNPGYVSFQIGIARTKY